MHVGAAPIGRGSFDSRRDTLLLIEVSLQALEDAKISLEDIASVEVTGGSSRVPAIISILKDFFKKDPSRTLNATEVISRGCALNCAMLSPVFK